LQRAKDQEWEQECLDLVAQGKPLPQRRKKQPTARPIPPSKVVVAGAQPRRRPELCRLRATFVTASRRPGKRRWS
jgi:hypothetical protein